MRSTLRVVLIVGVLLTVGGLWLGGSPFAVSVAVGAGMAYANLAVLARSVSRLLGGGGGSWALLFLLKFTGLFALTYLLIDRQLVQPLGLALGFGALPVGVTLGGLLTHQSPNNESSAGGLHGPTSQVAGVALIEGGSEQPTARRD